MVPLPSWSFMAVPEGMGRRGERALQVEDHNQTRVTGSSAKAARTVRVSTSVVCAADR